MKSKNIVRNILVGVLTGVIDVVPGISGDTILQETDTYSDLVISAKTLKSPSQIKEVLSDKKSIFNSECAVRSLYVVTGIIAGVVTSVITVDALIGIHRNATYGFFMGSILGGGYFVVKKNVKSVSSKDAPILLSGILVSLSISFLAVNLASNVQIMLVSGLLSAVALTLPSISGSFVLLVISQYEYMIDKFANALMLKNISASVITESLAFSIGFICGLIAGVKVISSSVNKTNNKRKLKLAVAGLFMGGSAAPLLRVDTSVLDVSVLASIIIGFSCILAIIYFRRI